MGQGEFLASEETEVLEGIFAEGYQHPPQSQSPDDGYHDQVGVHLPAFAFQRSPEKAFAVGPAEEGRDDDEGQT